jgi:hypothetical protein
LNGAGHISTAAFFFAKDVTGRLKSSNNACISAMQIAGRTQITRRIAALAQVVEHIIRNDGVAGSSPASGTIYLQTSPEFRRFTGFRARR